mgnify:CR=1 FL=1
MSRRTKGWRLRKRGNGIYEVRFTHEGKRYEVSKGKRNYRDAEKVAAQEYEDILSGRRREGQRVAVTREPLDVLFAEWLAEVEGRLDTSTAAQYQHYVDAHFLPFFKSLADMTTERGRDYVQRRLQDVKRKSVNKGAIDAARVSGLVQKEPVSGRVAGDRGAAAASGGDGQVRPAGGADGTRYGGGECRGAAGEDGQGRATAGVLRSDVGDGSADGDVAEVADSGGLPAGRSGAAGSRQGGQVPIRTRAAAERGRQGDSGRGLQ